MHGDLREGSSWKHRHSGEYVVVVTCGQMESSAERVVVYRETRQPKRFRKTFVRLLAGWSETFEPDVRCWLCGGSGKDPHFSINVCPECRGSGQSRP